MDNLNKEASIQYQNDINFWQSMSKQFNFSLQAESKWDEYVEKYANDKNYDNIMICASEIISALQNNSSFAMAKDALFQKDIYPDSDKVIEIVESCSEYGKGFKMYLEDFDKTVNNKMSFSDMIDKYNDKDNQQIQQIAEQEQQQNELSL